MSVAVDSVLLLSVKLLLLVLMSVLLLCCNNTGLLLLLLLVPRAARFDAVLALEAPPRVSHLHSCSTRCALERASTTFTVTAVVPPSTTSQALQVLQI